jgi:hypothetical protein
MTCALWSEGCQACRALANLKRMTGHSSAIWGPRKGCRMGQGRAGQGHRRGRAQQGGRGRLFDLVPKEGVTSLCAGAGAPKQQPGCGAALSLPWMALPAHSPARGAPRCAAPQCHAVGPRPVPPGAGEAEQATP